MWWRGGFEDPGHGIKRVSVTLVRKGTKKKKKTGVRAKGAMGGGGVGAGGWV